MARYTGPACRLCRREGTKLFLKGERCFSDKCAVARRGQAPGQHGAGSGRKRVKEYGLQLREKQKAKRYYGILEKQFRDYYEAAAAATLRWQSAAPVRPVRTFLPPSKEDSTMSYTAWVWLRAAVKHVSLFFTDISELTAKRLTFPRSLSAREML